MTFDPAYLLTHDIMEFYRRAFAPQLWRITSKPKRPKLKDGGTKDGGGGGAQADAGHGGPGPGAHAGGGGPLSRPYVPSYLEVFGQASMDAVFYCFRSVF